MKYYRHSLKFPTSLILRTDDDVTYIECWKDNKWQPYIKEPIDSWKYHLENFYTQLSEREVFVELL